MAKPRILLQLDTDPQPSVFDAITAIDSGAERLLQYGGVRPAQTADLVHGAMFTRGPQDLRSTAIFIGGANLDAGEAVLAKVRATLFDPLRVSVMLDSNGANTTAAAAVLSAARHGELAGAAAAVLAATGPVGGRVARLLAGQGAMVRCGSRDRERAERVCEVIRARGAAGEVTPHATAEEEELEEFLHGAQFVFACGAAGVQLLSAETLAKVDSLRVALDLNAVPPLGIEGVESGDRGVERGGLITYGALGVGGLKMKIHKAALAALFERNDLVLDAEEIFELGRGIAES